MYKFLILFFVLQLNYVYSNQKFEIFRSANIQLNKTSHRNSDFSAFYLDDLNVKADLDGQTNDKEDEAETHPIDFSKINFSKYRLPSKKDVLNSMQNDEVTAVESNQLNGKQQDDIKSKLNRKYSMKIRRSKFGSVVGSVKETPSSFKSLSGSSSNQIFNYDYYCSPKHYLTECLKKKLTSKFLIRSRSSKNRLNLNNTIEDLNKLSSSLQSTLKSNVRIEKSSNFKNVLLSLDRTFYNTDLLGQFVGSCILSYQKNCEKNF